MENSVLKRMKLDLLDTIESYVTEFVREDMFDRMESVDSFASRYEEEAVESGEIEAGEDITDYLFEMLDDLSNEYQSGIEDVFAQLRNRVEQED